ncbi:MAG: tRNA (adenosine(37)-N6)-threonylcarbamoyltransferase complex dimerization subunit type 1 TsaB [Pirellulaceae bacterium]|nr:tRNA (adenosine(37)-N6)-threonylcarbamoyltransferase complex dimerization subunit type 1 TsaB [Pirellulaceae bacterium]
MLNLAIECSGQHGSVAIAEDHQVLEFQDLPVHISSIQSLASTIGHMVEAIGRRPALISVTSGPGSFTGLRVGLATAKMLAMAWRIPVAPVDTLEVLANQIQHRLDSTAQAIIVPVINAFRKQVFTAAWNTGAFGAIVRLAPAQVVDAERWVVEPLASQAFENGAAERRGLQTDQIVVAGPGLHSYVPHTRPEQGRGRVVVLDPLAPSARWVAQVGWQMFQAGLHVSPAEVTACYVRASAAEEKVR